MITDRVTISTKTTDMYPASIYLLKVNRNIRKRCGIWSRITVMTPDRRQ